jgi:UDP:flavonoid glycosyltransferase YjiC (YdhE family)
VKTVLVMLSGSRFGSPVHFHRTEWPFDIDVVGRPAPENGAGPNAIRFHGKVADNRALARRADLVVVNGGFSAVSEGFSMRKPLVVIPVPHHAEQWVNAQTIQHLGVGIVGQETNLDIALDTAVQHVQRLREAYTRIDDIPDGAAQAADLIMSAKAL